MFRKARKVLKGTTFLLGSLGFGVFVYFKNQKNSLLRDRYLLTDQQIQEISKSEANLSLNANPKKERVIIIGSGVIGITTALYLLETQKYEVIILEKNAMISQETSFKNGCLFCPCLSEPWINQYVPKYFIKALIYKDFTIGIYQSMFKDLFSGVWIFNMLPNILPSKVEINREKLQKMAKISEEELNRLFSSQVIDPEKVESHIKGNLTLYEEKGQIPESFHKKMKKGYKGEILENSNIYNTEKCLKSTNIDKYKAAALILGDTNLNVYKFDLELVDYLKRTYPDSFKIFTNTTHQHFLFSQANQEIIGIRTNRGDIRGDHFIVAAGNYCKSVLQPLGFRIPITPVKGHALSVPIDQKNPQLTYNVTNDTTKIYMTQVGDIYRLSGAADFQGMDFEINNKRVEQLKSFIADMIGGNLNFDKAEGWCCLRPVSSDDVPIVGRLKGFDRVYINAGHGSKGLTLALGSAVLLRDVMEGKKGKLNAEDFTLDRFYLV